VYQAFIDPDALVAWLPPHGMNARAEHYEPRPGGTYRIVLSYQSAHHSTLGKTSDDSDVVRGRFIELVPNERIVQLVEFESEDPAFAGEMKMTWTLTAVPTGTEVSIRCENVPEGIRPEDHEAGFRSTLENLTAFTEGERMTMTEWLLAELDSEAARTRRVLAEVPEGKREWKPHDRSMAFGYLTDLVANILSWVGLAITLDELDVAPKSGPSYRPTPVQTSAEAMAALDKAVAQAREALQNTDDAHLATSWRLLAGGRVVMEQRRHEVIRDTFLHSSHHRGQMTVYLRMLEARVPSVYGPSADDQQFR
jgi:uncharacterized protein YndB with AHSA1/START domain/uncharacterized damage-inducible protein DinB